MTMSAGARYGWFVAISIIAIVAYFHLAYTTVYQLVAQQTHLDGNLVAAFVPPLLISLALSLILGLWWSGSGWRLGAIVTSILLGVAAFPIWLMVLIYVACWGVKRCTSAP